MKECVDGILKLARTYAIEFFQVPNYEPCFLFDKYVTRGIPSFQM